MYCKYSHIERKKNGGEKKKKKMANFVLQVPLNLTSFTVSASSNPTVAYSTPSLSFCQLKIISFLGAPPGGSGSNSGGGPVILELPLDKIRRPLMRMRANDQNKVQELMDSISQIGLQVPESTCSLLQIYVQINISAWLLEFIYFCYIGFALCLFYWKMKGKLGCWLLCVMRIHLM